MGLQFRKAPSSNAERIDEQQTLYYGTEFTVFEENGDWCHIRLDSGLEGWSRRQYEENTYIKKVGESSGRYISDDSRAVISDKFLESADKLAKKWAANTNINFLYGEWGGLDGRCHTWIATYTAPGKNDSKLMVAYNYSFGGLYECKLNDYVSFELEKNFIIPNDTTDGMYSPHWTLFYDRQIGNIGISSARVCCDNNVRILIDNNKNIEGDSIPETADNNNGICFVCDNGNWVIFVREDYSFYGKYYIFDGQKGAFLHKRKEFNDFIEVVENGNIEKVREMIKSDDFARRVYYLYGPMASYSWSGLFAAVVSDNIEMARVLIDNGADVNLYNPEGYNAATLYDIAISNSMKKMLRDAGAKSGDELFDY